MARKKKHEEHQNHEAWAIPYGDLITLLLAFFVVMYAMSSVNEGKYRILSDSLNAAFRGAPRSMEPIQVGERQVGSGADIALSLVQQGMLQGQPRALLEQPHDGDHPDSTGNRIGGSGGAARAGETPNMTDQDRVVGAVEAAMSDLILANVVAVRRKGTTVEVEIRTDVLFASGSATLTPQTSKIIERLATVLAPLGHAVRVEGHTDDQPIRNSAFPSNWELSAGRAASVVHVLAERGLDNSRLAIVGLGENHPVASNDTPEGRNQNRRVVIVVLGAGDDIPTGMPRARAGAPSPSPIALATAVPLPPRQPARAPAEAPATLASVTPVTARK